MIKFSGRAGFIHSIQAWFKPILLLLFRYPFRNHKFKILPAILVSKNPCLRQLDTLKPPSSPPITWSYLTFPADEMQKLYLFMNFKTYIATAKTPISVVQTKTFKAKLTK